MNLTTSVKALINDLDTVSYAVDRFAYPEIFACVLFDEGCITGFNYDMEITTRLEGAKGAGSAVIPLGLLRKALNTIPKNEIVTITADETSAFVKYKSGSIKLPASKKTDFPRFKIIRSKRHKCSEQFVKALKFVAPHISDNETRYYLHGAYFCVYKGQQVAVATNGHSMGCCPTGLENEVLNGVILPERAVVFINQFGVPHFIRHDTKAKIILLDFGDTILKTKQIDGTFPDWPRVLPAVEKTTPKIIIRPNTFINALRRAGYILPRFQYPVTLKSKDRQTYIGAIHEGAEAIEAIDDATCSADCHITFNYKYMQNILNSFGSTKTVEIKIIDKASPIHICDGGEHFAILMPIENTDKEIKAIEHHIERMKKEGKNT